jgi:hypothetical protein
MVDRVRADGGSAPVVTAVLGPSDESELIAEQQADRDREYAEVLERVPAFMAEIETETARGRATYTEVEESEADLARFERWLGSIQRRDYFDAPAGRTAEQAVQGCREALERFEAAAVEADTNDRSPAGRGVPTDGEPK